MRRSSSAAPFGPAASARVKTSCTISAAVSLFPMLLWTMDFNLAMVRGKQRADHVLPIRHSYPPDAIVCSSPKAQDRLRWQISNANESRNSNDLERF